MKPPELEDLEQHFLACAAEVRAEIKERDRAAARPLIKREALEDGAVIFHVRWPERRRPDAVCYSSRPRSAPPPSPRPKASEPLGSDVCSASSVDCAPPRPKRRPKPAPDPERDRQAAMASAVAGASGLTEWEVGFVASLREWLRSRPLTFRQEKVLERLHRDHVQRRTEKEQA